MPIVKPSLLIASAFAALALAQPASAYDASCHVNFPIVLSHHWGARAICADSAPLTGAAACVNAEDYQKYCVAKSVDANGAPVCGDWKVTPEEESLPPRNVNATNASLTRNMSGYHRYFSAAIVNRLRDTCGNKVYIADKPVFASYEVRARSLRNTVLQALASENASKVIVIGMSQGVQDARYMVAKLPMSDTNAALGSMKSKVAAIVSLVGEDGGAESSSLLLETLYNKNHGDWANRSNVDVWTESDFDLRSWKTTLNGRTATVLSEQCRGSECDLNTAQKYAWTVRSSFDLTPRYMRPGSPQSGLSYTDSWSDLKTFVGAQEDNWQDLIPAASEANNGIQYFNYSAKIRLWYSGWGSATSNDFLVFSAIYASSDSNDGYVGVARQQFANNAANFHNVKTLGGPAWSRGYHHMFFTGRNEALYTPPAGSREAAPYGGGAADFYQQVAKDLKGAGF